MTDICYLTTLRDTIIAAANAALAANAFTYNGFTVHKSYVPVSRIEDPDAQAGKLWVIPSFIDDTDRKTRDGIYPLVTRECSIQIAYQETNVAPSDEAKIDNRLLLREQLLDLAKNTDYSNPNYPAVKFLWCRNESLRDENGVPFHYYMLREAATFETFFTAYFKTPHQ